MYLSGEVYVCEGRRSRAWGAALGVDTLLSAHSRSRGADTSPPPRHLRQTSCTNTLFTRNYYVIIIWFILTLSQVRSEEQITFYYVRQY